jgi:hypothetical protein
MELVLTLPGPGEEILLEERLTGKKAITKDLQ